MTGIEDVLPLVWPALDDLQIYASEIAAGAVAIAFLLLIHSLVLHFRLRRLRRTSDRFEARIAALEWAEQVRLNASLRKPTPDAASLTPALSTTEAAAAAKAMPSRDDEFEDLIESLQRA